MQGPFRKMRRHYLALLIIAILIISSIDWIYRIVSRSLGEDLALISLTITVIVVTAFMVRGAVYASHFEGFLQGQETTLKNPPPPGATIKPFELKAFGMVLFRYPDVPFEFKVDAPAQEGEVYQLEGC